MNPSPFHLNLALVIGINDYGREISPLGTARQDAEAIAAILEQEYNYQVRLLTEGQATGAALRQYLETELPQVFSNHPSARLLFYFAGHGIALNGDEGPQGYLIPQDAQLGDIATYLPMPWVEGALSQLSCRHCLVILDCCFAGAFRWSSTRKLAVIEETIHQERFERFIRDPAWQVITSAADQFALDNLDLHGARGAAPAGAADKTGGCGRWKTPLVKSGGNGVCAGQRPAKAPQPKLALELRRAPLRGNFSSL